MLSSKTGGWLRAAEMRSWLPLGLLLLVAAALPARAEYRELDAIVAIVNEDVVLASELLSRLDQVQKQIEAAQVQPPPNNVLVSQIMERLILESLQLQEADRRGVQVDDETLTRAVMSFAQQNNMTLEQFQRALAEDGVSYFEFREQIRREMVLSRLQRNLVSRRIAISDKDINDLLNSPYYQQLLSDEYRVGHILLAIAEDASEGAARAARERGSEIVAQLRAGADFRELAFANSAASTALEGGDLGWRKAGELPSLFAEQVLDLQPGETAEPILTANAVHIVQLLEVRGASTQSEEQTHARHILVQPSQIRSEAETEALIRSIHERLQAGEDFVALAQAHSQDPGSALNGGDLGWVSGEEFVPEFRTAMTRTSVGQVSEPFRSQYGWHVLEVLGRREQDMSEEARRNMALQILHQRRFEEELMEWQKQLRDEAFVEVRL
jgi:peptidyl-prolyl cis-trans isomerase SurA